MMPGRAWLGRTFAFPVPNRGLDARTVVRPPVVAIHDAAGQGSHGLRLLWKWSLGDITRTCARPPGRAVELESSGRIEASPSSQVRAVGLSERIVVSTVPAAAAETG